MKNLGGRPSKMTQHFMEVAERVITDNILACTDEDILFLINEKLEESEKIAGSTWEFWKAGKYGDDERRDWFLGVIKKALIIERNNILSRLKDDDKAWQRWAWIMERKFDDWNIKNKSDITSAGKEIKYIPIMGGTANVSED
jgi:hypothetical protein